MFCCVLSICDEEYPFYKTLTLPEKMKLYSEALLCVGRLMHIGCRNFVFGFSGIGESQIAKAIKEYKGTGENVDIYYSADNELNLLDNYTLLSNLPKLKEHNSPHELMEHMINVSDYVLIIWNGKPSASVYSALCYAQSKYKIVSEIRL